MRGRPSKRPPGQQRPGNKSVDSNGPNVKVRGTAAQVYEKYQVLAREAQRTGNRVVVENLLQHAEHYYRLSNAAAAAKKAPGAKPDRQVGETVAETGSGHSAPTETTTETTDKTVQPAANRPGDQPDQPELALPAAEETAPKEAARPRRTPRRRRAQPAAPETAPESPKTAAAK